MRIEWKPDGETQEQPKEPVIHESDLTKEQKRQMEKQKLKEMSWGKRIQYIWMYYKPAMAAVLVIALLIYIVSVSYRNSKIDTVLSFAVVESRMEDTEEVSGKIRETLGWDSKYQEIAIDSSLFLDVENKLNYSSQMSFSTKIGAASIDVVLMPEELYESSFHTGDYFLNLEKLLDADTCEKLGDSLQGERLVLKNSSVAKEFSLPYEPVIVCVVANAPNPENAIRWIEEFCIS